MATFTHEKLEAYQVAIEFLVLADSIAGVLPRGRAYLGDQLRRAALSVPLNIAEGGGEFATADKARFYRMARRSGTECAAILHACEVLSITPREHTQAARATLDRIVAMLTALVRRLTSPGTGAGADAGVGSRDV
jgi:four helix bundle protein